MRGFDDIDPYKPRGNANPNFHSPVSGAIRGALESEYVLPSDRVPKLRPSSFPKCPVLDFLKLWRHKNLGYIEEERSFGSDYFTGVGTVVHEIIQHHIGNTKQVYGNWKCTNVSCSRGQDAFTVIGPQGNVIKKGKITAFETTNNICPECDRPMFYEELEIEALGSVGHVDCILVIKKDKWWVVDYKTTLKRKVEKGLLPEKKHLYQLRAYAYILKFHYNLPIQGFSLVYLPRDNPFKFYEYSHDFDKPHEYGEAKKILKQEKKKFKSAEKSVEQGSYLPAYKNKPCSCREEYFEKMDFYNECPLLDICFKKKKMHSFLDSYTKLHQKRTVPHLEKMENIIEVVKSNDYETLRKKYKSSRKKSAGPKFKSALEKKA